MITQRPIWALWGINRLTKRLQKGVTEILHRVLGRFQDFSNQHKTSWAAFKWLLKSVAVVVVSFGVFTVLTSTKPSGFTDERELAAIHSKFGKHYDQKILSQTIKPDNSQSLLVFGNDTKAAELCLHPKTSLQPAKLQLYQKDDTSLISRLPFWELTMKPHTTIIFASDATHPQKDVYNTTLIDKVSIQDLDGDGFDEIIIRTLTPLCGTGGAQNQIILTAKDGYSTLHNGLPDQSFDFQADEKSPLKHFEINSSSKYEYVLNGKRQSKELLSTSADKYLETADIDGDGTVELIEGVSLYEYPEIGAFYDSPQDCHSYCGHKWLIGVYKYVNGTFLVDNKWNDGNLYLTDQKIDLWDAFGYSDSSRNLAGLRMPNYFLCEICDPFNNYTRRPSEIMKEVKLHYGETPKS